MSAQLTEIRLSGFGGQGIVMSGFILGSAATLFDNRNAAMTRSYGPESRGGACAADVVVADGPIAYPKVTHPDVVVAMSQDAYLTYGARRPKDSLLIVDNSLVTLNGETGPGGRILEVPATRLAEELGRAIVANMVMLGFLCRHTDIVSVEALKGAIADIVPDGTEELNLAAFDAGYEYE